MEKLQLRVIFSMGPTLEGVRVRRISLAQIAAAAMTNKYVRCIYKCIELAMDELFGCIGHFCQDKVCLLHYV